MNRKIIIRLSGGLGNQMFMYAAARALALRTSAKLYLDCSQGFKTDLLYKRHFALEHFNINLHHTPRLLSFDYLGGNYIQRISRHIKRHFPYTSIRYIFENSQKNAEQLLSLPSLDYYLEGYWQSEKYFSDYKEQIRTDFKITKPLSKAVQKEVEMIEDLGDRCIALCVRRYQEVKKIVNISIVEKDYYLKAMDLLSQNIPNPVFLCFSQTPEWVKENLTGKYEIRFIAQKDKDTGNIDDLFLLTHCRHFIISNSTFYWWGAWLANYENKKIIAPDNWIFPDTPLKEWIILK